MVDIQTGTIVASSTAAVLAILSLLVGRVGGFKGRHGAFALFGASFGLGVIAGNTALGIWGLWDPGPEPLMFFILSYIDVLGAFLMTGGLWWLLRTTGPVPARAGLLVALGIGSLFVALAAAGLATGKWDVGIADRNEILYWGIPWMIGAAVQIGSMVGAATVLAWRVPSRPPAEARDDRIMAAALVLYPFMWLPASSFMSVMLEIRYPWLRVVWIGVAATVLAAVFLRSQLSTGRRVDLLLAWLPALAALMGMTVWMTTQHTWLAAALARTIEIALIAYTLLRHNFLDLDVKLRWTVSKSTLAAMFLAVFFIVSEGATALFSESLGTELGIIAAGALVFTIAPLMRLADRFAATAVPIASPSGLHDVYREAVAMALVDGRIDDEEEDRLAALSDRLGLTSQTARQIRLAVLRS